MSNPQQPSPSARDSARRKAQNHFEAAEARTALVKQITNAESAALDARTAKLKALRLAKEEADRAAAAKAPAPASVAKPRRKVVRA